jgi:hypothetical protein
VARRVVRFPGSTWSVIEDLPEPARQAVLRAVAYLVEDPVPSLAEPFPDDGDPLPGAYELRLPADDVTIWYAVATDNDGTQVILIQHVE